MAMAVPSDEASHANQEDTRRSSPVSDSPPCGAASGSVIHAPRSSAGNEDNEEPAQDPKSHSASEGTISQGPTNAAVSRARSSGLERTEPRGRRSRNRAAAARPPASRGSSAPNAAARTAAVLPWRTSNRRRIDQSDLLGMTRPVGGGPRRGGVLA